MKYLQNNYKVKLFFFFLILCTLKPYLFAEPYKFQRFYNPETDSIIDCISDQHTQIDDPQQFGDIPYQEYLLPEEKDKFSVSCRSMLGALRKLDQEGSQKISLFWEFDKKKEKTYGDCSVPIILHYASELRKKLKSTNIELIYADEYRTSTKEATFELIGWQIKRLQKMVKEDFMVHADLENLKEEASKEAYNKIKSGWDTFIDNRLKPFLQECNQKTIKELIDSGHASKPLNLRLYAMDYEVIIKMFTDQSKHKIIFAGGAHIDTIAYNLKNIFGYKKCTSVGINNYGHHLLTNSQLLPEIWHYLSEPLEIAKQRFAKGDFIKLTTSVDFEDKIVKSSAIGDNAEKIQELIVQAKGNYVDVSSKFIHLAAKKKWPKTAQKISNQQNLNSFYKGKLPLMLAAEHDNSKILKIFLKNGANPNCEISKGSTILNWSAAHGYSVLATLLIKYGANIQSYDLDGNTPLITATRNNKTSLAEKLLEHKFDYECAVRALHFAIENKNNSLVKKFLACGVDPNARHNEMSPLCRAANINDIASAVLLLNHGANDDQDDYKSLFWTITNGNDTFSELLFERGASLDGFVCETWTPLGKAVNSKRYVFAEKLLERNANPNLGDPTPFSFALTNEHFDFAEKLLDKGANINMLNRQDATRLYWAINRNKYDAAKFLLDHNADPNCGDDNPLLEEVEKSSPNQQIVRLLLQKGADINCQNSDGNAPFHIASRNADSSLFFTLLRGQDPDDQDWNTAINWNLQNNFGNTPLHVAFMYNNDYVAEYLIAIGVANNIKNSNGQTAWDINQDNIKHLQKLKEKMMSSLRS